MPKNFTQFGSESAPSSDDLLLLFDNASNSNKKITIGVLAVAIAASLPNGSIGPSKLALGSLEAYVATSQSTAVQSYGDLATVGPSVSVTIGASGQALVSIYSFMSNNAAHSSVFLAFAVSGATTIAATDTRAIQWQAYAANAYTRQGITFLVSGLNPGINTFTLKYRVDGNVGGWLDRRIAVIPL